MCPDLQTIFRVRTVSNVFTQATASSIPHTFPHEHKLNRVKKNLDKMGNQGLMSKMEYRYPQQVIETIFYSVLIFIFLLWVIVLWTWVYKYLFEPQLWILLDIYLEVELLDHMLTQLLLFWRKPTFKLKTDYGDRILNGLLLKNVVGNG